MQMTGLKDRVAIVVGGAGNIGRATCLRLSNEGVKVAVADLNTERASKIVDEIKERGCQAMAIKTDIRNIDETDQMAKATIEYFGKIDILANIAGGSMPAGAWGLVNHSTLGPFEQSTEEDWDLVTDINLNGVRNTCRAVIPYMIKRKYGKIVNVSSIAGTQGFMYNWHYAAAKAGIIALTKSLAKEFGQYWININSVSPGIIGTGRIKSALESENAEEKKLIQTMLASICLGDKWGRAEDVANVIVFLSSDDARFVTGANYLVDGGMTLGYP
jgi:NAD(P)-dependent dehydrogenase (short-subunit alcohol dehydrogenase family)